MDNSPYFDHYYNGVYDVIAIGIVDFSYDVDIDSCGILTLRGPASTSVRAMCTRMVTSAITMCIGIPAELSGVQ